MWDRAHRLPTSDQSRASHSGGQLWLLQGSVREGRSGLHAESSRTFSSVTEILLLHKTCRVRRPPLQLRLHSDHSPVHQLQAHKLSISANRRRNQPAAQLSSRGTVASKKEKMRPNSRPSSSASPRGARLSVAWSSLLLGPVLLVAEVIVDDHTIGVLHAHHLLCLYP